MDGESDGVIHLALSEDGLELEVVVLVIHVSLNGVDGV